MDYDSEYIQDIQYKLKNGEYLTKRELKKIFLFLKDVDNYEYIQYKNKYKKDILKINKELFINRIKKNTSFSDLKASCDYVSNLMRENKKHYKTLAIYSELCSRECSCEEANDYFTFLLYTNNYNKIVSDMLSSIYNRPCNSVLKYIVDDVIDRENIINDEFSSIKNRVENNAYIYRKDIKLLKKYK